MFALRGVAVALSVFVIVYGVLSVVVGLCSRTGWPHGQRNPARRGADLLFVWRMLPLVTAAIVTAAFTVPSFLLLEPRAIHEPLGGIPLALGICAAGLGIFGVMNAGVALRRVSRVVARWTNEARPIQLCSQVPVLRISAGASPMNQPAKNQTALALPAMTVAGIVRPKVLLSGAAEAVLTAGELRTALNHEVAHVRRRDNLKKLMLRCVTFPGMAGLEAAWLEATEMAADDAAVSNAGEALDLAAALIKLSRLRPAGLVSSGAAADLTTALVHGPASAVNARVARLLAWNEEGFASSKRFSAWYGLGAVLAIVAVFGFTYSHLLVSVHTATEWLVR